MNSDPDKYLGRDVYTYSQDKERFVKELFQFHHGRGTQFLNLPSVSGHPVDLYLLYSWVTKNGGFHKVCDKNLWWKISPELLSFPPACVNAELGLKQIYMRYLYLFERVYIHGDDPDHPDDDDSGPRGAKTSRILVHQVPMTYNYRQHRVRGGDRAHYGLSTNTVKPNEYERLEKSLLSGLPNEVDFAINVCCILSMESPNAIKLLRHRTLIDLLLAHIALFSESSTLHPLYHQEWFPKTKRNFTQFWYESIDHQQVDFGTTLLDMISCPEHRLQDQNCYLGKQKYVVGSELFHLGRDKDGKDSVFHRIQQICNIIRNLSFDSLNAKVLSESNLVFNFTMLCCHSTLPEVKRNGMDILANISKMYVIPPVHESSAQLIIRSLHRWIHSEDKQEMVSALLVIAALSQVDQNEEAIVEAMSDDIYCRIVSLARIYDLQLIVASLDALYYLSEIGEATCEAISLVKHCIDFLANLVTVETQSFGESALGGIIVRDHGLAPPPQIPQVGSHPPRSIGTAMGPPATPFNSRPMPLRPPMMPGHSPLPSMNRPQTPASAAHTVPRPQTPPHRPGQPRAGLVPPHRTILPATPQNLATMSPDQVASNWLRANYEPYPGALVFTAKVHQEYVLWLQRRAGQAATPVQPGMFVNCVKKVFPYSELVVSGPESQISGVRWKPPQTLQPGAPSNQTPAHLRQPPGQQPPAYNSHHMLTSGSAANGMPPRIASPSHMASHDMLRSMLLSDSPNSRARSNSTTSSTMSSGKSLRAPRGRKRGRGSGCTSPRARSSGDSPLPPISPSMELQVCGSAEKVESFVNGASLARIERVENPQSPAVLSNPASQPNRISERKTSHNAKPTNNDLSQNPNSKRNNDPSLHSTDLKQSTNKKLGSEEDNDSAMDTSERGPPSHESIKTNGCQENGPTTPSDTLSSPPVCNGNTSDTDSLLTEPTKQPQQKLVNGVGAKSDKDSIKVNGSGDTLQKLVSPCKNGFINGIEKLIARIPGDGSKSNMSLKQQPSEHRRHHSGDSLASQSSTSTQLSMSQNSMSSDTRLELPDQTTNQLPMQSMSSNQMPYVLPKPSSSQPTASTYQQPAQTSTSNQQAAQVSAANHNIPTVVESLSKQIIVPTHPINSIGVSISSSPVPPKSPLASPGASSKKGGRKRRRSTASNDSRQSLPEAPGQYKCLWECCGAGFPTCSLLRKHVSITHTTTPSPCLWAGCDRTERKRWALVSHVNERHTSDSVLAKALANREKGILPPQATVQTQPVYTPQAARLAILRNFPKSPFPDFLDSREGPVTKHIRFTAALILRNVCRYSSTGRTLLKKHESKLAVVAGSNMEASTAIVNCLYEIQQAQHL